VPPIVSCVIALITLPLALRALPKELMESAALSTSGLVAVFLAVWGATDVARGQKVLSAMFISTGKEKGQGLVEYTLILVLVAIVVIVILAVVGPIIGNVFSNMVLNI
jgi:pilus assembly protein Flp/PilA